MPRHYSLLLLLLAPTPVLAQGNMPVVQALPSDFALTQLPPGASGRATVSITATPGVDELSCKATSVKGGAAIGTASCRLIILKWGWLPSIKDKQGKELTIPKIIVEWPTDKKLERTAISDFGGATPISPGHWITDLDYPPSARMKKIQGVSGFSFDISPFGLVTGCTITSSSGNQDLDSQTCSLISRRGRFLPALDAQNRPVATKGKSIVHWVLPS